MLHGLLQRPVAKADHVAVVGVGEQPGDALGAAQLQADIRVGSGAQGEGGEGESSFLGEGGCCDCGVDGSDFVVEAI